jgi:hypothetical protein
MADDIKSYLEGTVELGHPLFSLETILLSFLTFNFKL